MDTPNPEPDDFPATPSQTAHLDWLTTETWAPNRGLRVRAWHVVGRLDSEALFTAFTQVAARHQALTASFWPRNRQWRVAPTLGRFCTTEVVRPQRVRETPADVVARVVADHPPLDPADGPRVALYTALPEGRPFAAAVLVLIADPLVVDDRSAAVLAAALARAYTDGPASIVAWPGAVDDAWWQHITRAQPAEPTNAISPTVSSAACGPTNAAEQRLLHSPLDKGASDSPDRRKRFTAEHYEALAKEAACQHATGRAGRLAEAVPIEVAARGGLA